MFFYFLGCKMYSASHFDPSEVGMNLRFIGLLQLLPAMCYFAVIITASTNTDIIITSAELQIFFIFNY